MAAKIPLGEPLQLSVEDIERLSEITDFDLTLANIAWVQESPRWAKNILLADQPEEIKNK
jgi:hypothetical protein